MTTKQITQLILAGTVAIVAITGTFVPAAREYASTVVKIMLGGLQGMF